MTPAVFSPRPEAPKIPDIKWIIRASESRVLTRETSTGQHHRDARVSMDGDLYDQTCTSSSTDSAILLSRQLDAPSSFNTITSNPETVSPTTPTRSSPRVRFRSRVRITSGLHHHRHKWSQSYDIGTDVHAPSTSTSCSSSRSGSPSSSISAPLRSHPNSESDPNSVWGPLGQRVSFLVSRQRAIRDKEVAARQRKRAKLGLFGPLDVCDPAHPTERTPLASTLVRSSYVQGECMQDCDVFNSQEDDADNARLARETDLLFGKWPERLLNYRWWWWHLESIVCCRVDDSDGYD